MKMKQTIAAILAATMVMSTGLTVCAAGSGSAAPVSAEKTESSSDNGSTSTAAATVKASGAEVTVAGSKVKTSIAGAYAAQKVQGVAVVNSLADVKSKLNLSGSQTPYVMIFDTDVKKSSKAMDSVNAAITAMGGGEVAATLNIDLGAKEKGKYVSLSDGSVGMVVGLPKEVDTAKSVSVVCVRPGGKTTILEDTDTNPKTVTFEVQAGLGTYAIVTK
ncbi:MAG: hypothetical protein K2O91_06650 [Lachnospiraceae bacterium]|nr:hypothetical protein [Lachnospiraceae bacterium]